MSTKMKFVLSVSALALAIALAFAFSAHGVIYEYQWEYTDASNPQGTCIDPAKDCMKCCHFGGNCTQVATCVDDNLWHRDCSDSY